jgi:large subunit ribosomal protein L37Ae
MGRTKKVGPLGRYGVRYGVGIKKRYLELEKELRKKKACPNCSKLGLKRVAAGVWECKKCGHKFSGGAYKP